MVAYTTIATESGKSLGGGCQMKLNDDILFLIMEVQAAEHNIRDLGAMTRCCRRLRTEGVKHLLRCGVRLDFDEDVESFSRFMFADEQHRFPALEHSLFIDSTLMSSESTDALVKVAQKISHLERLVLHDVGGLLAKSAFLESLQSQLKTAVLHFRSGDMDPRSQYRFLVNSAHSLTELHATDIDPLLINSPIFPTVRRLVLRCSKAPLMFLFSQTFPNIISLDFTCTDPSPREYQWDSAEFNAGPDGVVPWSALESITGTMEDLYYVGLEDVLISTTPSGLHLDVDLKVFSSGKYNALQKMFMEAGQLDAMHLDIVVRGVRRETELEGLHGWVSCMVKPLRFASWKSQALPDLPQNTICGGIGRASIEESSDELDAGSFSDKLDAGSSSDEDLD